MSRGLDVAEELRRQAAYVAEIVEWPASAGPGHQEGSGARAGRASPGGPGGLELAMAEGPVRPGSQRGEDAPQEGAELEAAQGEEVNLRWVNWTAAIGLQLITIFLQCGK